jgi:acetyl esterase/lipase
VLVQIVSGGWRSDPPQGKPPSVLDAYHDMGYSVIAVCHRTIDENVAWPAPADDVARAIQFIRLHAKEWNIDPDRLALTGRSSGGHVAMMVAFGKDRANPNSDDPVSRQSSRVRCVIEQGGPSDLSIHMRKLISGEQTNTQRRDYLKGRLQYLLAVKPEQVDTEESYRRLYEISPIRLVNKDTVPVLMLYGGPEGITSLDDPRLVWDTHTPISGLMLAEKLKEFGVPYSIVIAPDLARDSPRSLEAHRAFFEKYNGPR